MSQGLDISDFSTVTWGNEKRPSMVRPQRGRKNVMQDEFWEMDQEGPRPLLRILAFLPKVEVQPFYYFLRHSSITGFSWKVFGNRGQKDASSGVSEWQTASSSVVVSATGCGFRVSSPSHCFVELKGRWAWIRHGLVTKTQAEKGKEYASPTLGQVGRNSPNLGAVLLADSYQRLSDCCPAQLQAAFFSFTSVGPVGVL